jgi:hypothetical protein
MAPFRVLPDALPATLELALSTHAKHKLSETVSGLNLFGSGGKS